MSLTTQSPAPSLSPVVAGTWRMGGWDMDASQRLRWIEQCIELGITSFDLADVYGDYGVEALFGQALAQAPSLRQKMQIVTKCGIKLVSEQRPSHAIKSYDTSAAHINASVDASLRALQTDCIDLLLIHRPDFLMHPQELAHTFKRLHQDGKVRGFGVSNHTTSQLGLLHHHVPVSTHQIELSPLCLNALGDGTLDQCIALGIRPMIWSPLAGGRLFQSDDAQSQRVRAVLQDLGQVYGVSAATIAFAWIVRHPSRPHPITGSQRISALKEAVAACSVRLSAQDWYRVWEASTGQAVP